jgi:sulfide:quinone oxidoreductase
MPAPLSAGPRCVHATRRRGHSRRELGRDIREESGSTSRARLSRTASPNCRRTVSTSPGARSRRLCRSRTVSRRPARSCGSRRPRAVSNRSLPTPSRTCSGSTRTFPASTRSCRTTSSRGARSARDACCARRPCSKTSRRRTKRPYERELESRPYGSRPIANARCAGSGNRDSRERPCISEGARQLCLCHFGE